MLNKYPAYKDSGVEWLGGAPDHWGVLKIKRLSQVKRGASPRPIDDPKYFDDNGEFGWVRIADVTASERYLEATTQQLSELGSSLSVKRYPNDLFLSIAGTVGKPIISKIKCCIHDGFVWFPDLKVNPEFFYYVFTCGQLFQGLGKWGTQLNLNTETVGDIHITLPQKEEIDSIVNYLDKKTELIDELISKKRRQIELLTEQRQAVINQAVTKGLDPNVEMKDSGIEWLGKIPKHWEMKKLKWIVSKIGSGVTPRGGAQVYQDEGVPLLRSQNIHFDGLRLDDVAYISDEIHQSMKNSQVNSNDVLLNITGASIGRCSVVPTGIGEANVNQHVCIMRPMDCVMSDYLHLVMSANIGQLQVFNSQNGTSREGLNFEQLGNFIIPLPNIDEQEKVVYKSTELVNGIYNSISNAKQQIQLLQEYRTALISEAVTGKIDVREAG